KKATCRLSGDQKGNDAPSVPASGSTAIRLKARSHNMFLPAAARATKTMNLPSGDSSGKHGTSPSGSPKGAPLKVISKRTLDSLTSKLGGGTLPVLACPALFEIHFSSNPISCADCQRSSGSLARQVRTRRSRAGGVIGSMMEIGWGSAVMMEEIRLAWLLPAKAFFPAVISYCSTPSS